jgi:hypothetical protein
LSDPKMESLRSNFGKMELEKAMKGGLSFVI